MTDEIYGLKERSWRYGEAHGQRVGLNTAFILLDRARECPDALPELIDHCKELIKTADEEYAFFKAEAKQYSLEHFGEEEEDDDGEPT